MSMAIEIVSGICLLTGAAFCIIGGIGILRLPDLYARTHAATITDTLGAGLMLLGLMGFSGLSLVTVKLALLIVLLWVTSPTIGHALVKAAYAQGVCAPAPEPQVTVTMDAEEATDHAG